jgi:hypothetical protein
MQVGYSTGRNLPVSAMTVLEHAHEELRSDYEDQWEADEETHAPATPRQPRLLLLRLPPYLYPPSAWKSAMLCSTLVPGQPLMLEWEKDSHAGHAHMVHQQMAA